MKQIHQKVDEYYTNRLKEHGKTHWGVDWNSTASQYLRFDQQMKVVYTTPFSILDYGCGYGEFVNYLRQRHDNFQYIGYDISLAMVQAAQEAYPDVQSCRFSNDLKDVEPVDYVMASGIFNVRLETAVEEWTPYVLETINEMWRMARKGIAFNMLTSYSDKEYMRDYLYYADPLYWFDHLKRNFSRHVALLHDYGLYEFTMIVKRDIKI